MAVSSTSSLRMSGMNSGLDTESIVNAMTAATKLKITKQNRKAITLKWKQEAYQSVISKLTSFQDKYFNSLNPTTNLKSKSLFNQYGATVTNKTGGTATTGAPAGVTVTCNNSASSTSYDVTVNQVATQAKYAGSALDASSLELGNYTNSTQQYSFTLKVGDKTANVVFNGGTKDDVIKSINTQLKDTFGASNTSDKGLVYMDTTGKLVSSDKTSMSMSGVSNLSGSTSINTDLSSVVTGTNNLTIQVGTQTKTVSFQTFASDYFNDMEGNETKTKLYNSIKDAKLYEDYLTAKEDPAFDADALKADALKQNIDGFKQFHHDTSLAHDMELAKVAAFEDGVADGSIKDITYEEWCKTDAFDEEAFTAEFEANYTGLTEEELQKAEETFLADYDEGEAYKSLHASEELTGADAAKFASNANFVDAFNFELEDGTTVSMDENGVLKANNGAGIAVSAQSGSANTFGAATATSTASQITTATTLKELGMSEDATFTINGKSFTFTADTSIKTMMNEINSSDAGVKMTYSTLTNSFTVNSTAYGTAAKIDISADMGTTGDSLITKLGLTSGTTTAGQNTELVINGETVETSSNSFTVDGTTMTFTKEAVGSSFTAGVERDFSAAISAIKSFVEDYNSAVKEIYTQLDQKTDSDYYALTDEDIEEMDLSETQQEKWETKAKEGLLHSDSAISTVMTGLRSVLYESIDLGDGKSFGLFSMGITTSDDWTSHGTLVLDETKLKEAFETNADNIAELFTGTSKNEAGETVQNGIMYKFDNALTGAVKSTGARKDKGTLVQIAGLATGTSSTDNSIFDQLKSINTLVKQLEDRYDQQQNRYWKQFSNLESMMGSLNSQQTYISQLMSF